MEHPQFRIGRPVNWLKTDEWEQSFELTEADDRYGEINPYEVRERGSRTHGRRPAGISPIGATAAERPVNRADTWVQPVSAYPREVSPVSVEGAWRDGYELVEFATPSGIAVSYSGRSLRSAGARPLPMMLYDSRRDVGPSAAGVVQVRPGI